MSEAVLRELLARQEQHAAAVRKANEDYAGALRQIIEMLLSNNERGASDMSKM